MLKHEIFYALCSLFNEGEAVINMDNANQDWCTDNHLTSITN